MNGGGRAEAGQGGRAVQKADTGMVTPGPASYFLVRQPLIPLPISNLTPNPSIFNRGTYPVCKK
jgi:hypothetical protein